jgi:hypothetical protein
VSDRNGNVTPRLGYTGRLAGDAANTLPGAEQTVTAPRGNAVQTGTGNRWGDYSSMHVDPADECLFWYANEYVPATGNPFSTFNWSTNIVSFRVNTGACAQPEKGTITGLVTNATSGNAPVPDANATASGAYFRQTDAAGNYSMMVAPGTYNMTHRAGGGGGGRHGDFQLRVARCAGDRARAWRRDRGKLQRGWPPRSG